jgi:hypothetical protein
MQNGSQPARPSRRRLFRAAGGASLAAAAIAAEQIARPVPASAADGNPVILGADNTAMHETTIANTGGAGALLLAQSASASPTTSALLEVQGSLALASGTAKTIWLVPSGDTTGATDVAAISALLSAGHTVHLLPGDYYINATLSIPAGQALTGSPCGLDKNSGSMATRIHLAAHVNNHMISLSGKAAYVGYLELDGNRANQTSQYGNGVLCLTGSNSSIIERCLIHDQYYRGIDITDSTQGISVIGCVVVNNNNDGIFIANSTSDHHISGTAVGSNGAHNIETSGYVVHIHECDIYSANKDGILATGGGWATLITNCGIDRNQQNGIEIQSPGVTVSACTLHSNSQAGNGLYSSIVVDNITGITTVASVEGCVFWIDGGITNKVDHHIHYQTTTALAKTHGNVFQPGTVTKGNISGPSAPKDTNETG